MAVKTCATYGVAFTLAQFVFHYWGHTIRWSPSQRISLRHTLDVLLLGTLALVRPAIANCLPPRPKPVYPIPDLLEQSKRQKALKLD